MQSFQLRLFYFFSIWCSYVYDILAHQKCAKFIKTMLKNAKRDNTRALRLSVFTFVGESQHYHLIIITVTVIQFQSIGTKERVCDFPESPFLTQRKKY
jgi:hypothetical protein